MRSDCRSRALILAMSMLAMAAARATEGGGGRPITGQQVNASAGIVPPEPGWVVTLASIYYDGDIEADRNVPIIGSLSAGLEMKVSYNMANVTYVWNTGPGAWNFASAVGLPLQMTDVNVNLTTPRAGIGSGDNSTQFADMLFTPISAGYHFSKTDHLALSLPIYAPTGSYDANRLANAGQNVWTYMPSIAYTHLGQGSEFSLLSAVEIYTRNDTTNYKSGELFRLDALWTAAVAPGWQLGLVGGWIEQLTDDEGPLADRLNGFKGHSFGLGPIANWSGKLGGTPSTLSFRWVPDIDAKNRAKGNGFAITLNLLLF